MQLSHIGVIADLLWYEIKNHAQCIKLGAFVVMPNHIHGVLILDNPDNDGGIDDVKTRDALSLHQNNRQNDHQSQKSIGQKRLRNPGKNSISTIIGGYKSAVTKHANRLHYPFKWQARFYDHIIRDEKSFRTISNYINNNPQKWDEDKFYNKP